MAWNDGIDRATNYIITAINWNDLLGAAGSLMQLKSHAHGGTTGEGSQAIGPLTTEDFTDAAAPAAPSAGRTRIYTVSGKPRYRPNGGADRAIITDETAGAGDLTGTYPAPTLAKITLGSDADGDIYYRASSLLARLPKGTALQGLRMNAGATAPEWASVVGTSLLDKDVSTTTICVSSTAEADAYRKTIGGNVIGATGGLYIFVAGDLIQNTGGGAPQYTFRFKFGATTLFTGTASITSDATRIKWVIEARLLQSATNAQRWAARLKLTAQANTWSAGPGVGFIDSFDYGTSAEDTTASKDVAVTGQCDTSNANIDIRQQMAFIEQYA